MFDFPFSISDLFSSLPKEQKEAVKELRRMHLPFLYPGMAVDDDTLKLSCLLFEKVCVPVFTAGELQQLHSALDGEEPDRATASSKRRARLILREAQQFLDRTEVLRDEEVLITMAWEGGTAAIFQPPSIDLGFQQLYLGESEMNLLAQEIEDEPEIRNLPALSTLFELSCLREASAGDIAKSSLRRSVAVTELVGTAELFGMTPMTHDRVWAKALYRAMSGRRHESQAGLTATRLGLSLMQHSLPSVNVRSYDDILEAREYLRGELPPFWEFLRQNADAFRNLPFEECAEAIEKASKQLSAVIRDIEMRLRSATVRVVRRMSTDVLSMTPPAMFAYMVPNLSPVVTSSVNDLLDELDNESGLETRAINETGVDNRLSFLIRARRRLRK